MWASIKIMVKSEDLAKALFGQGKVNGIEWDGMQWKDMK